MCLQKQQNLPMMPDIVGCAVRRRQEHRQGEHDGKHDERGNRYKIHTSTRCARSAFPYPSIWSTASSCKARLSLLTNSSCCCATRSARWSTSTPSPPSCRRTTFRCRAMTLARHLGTVLARTRTAVPARDRAMVLARGRVTVPARRRATNPARDRAMVPARGRVTVPARRRATNPARDRGNWPRAAPDDDSRSAPRNGPRAAPDDDSRSAPRNGPRAARTTIPAPHRATGLVRHRTTIPTRSPVKTSRLVGSVVPSAGRAAERRVPLRAACR